MIKINYLKDNLTIDEISKYVYDYMNNVSYNNSLVNHYINNDLEYIITIFNIWYCTNELLKFDYFEINPNILFNKINNNLSNRNNYIFLYTNLNYKNYIEIYDKSEKIKINIDSICPDCFEGNNLIIKNNFTNEIINELGKVIMNKIIENNIDPFNKDEQIFNNICKNFTIETIDIPIKERRQIMFLKLKEKELICNDVNCITEDYFLSNLTGNCNCNISTNFNYLFHPKDVNKTNLDEYENFINSKSKINSFLILKCGKEAFNLNNLKINAGFYISIIIFFIQLILYSIFVILYLYQKNNYKKVAKQNPPKIQKFEINDDFEEKEDSKEQKSSQNNKEINKENLMNLYKIKRISIFDNENNNKEKSQKQNDEIIVYNNKNITRHTREKERKINIYRNMTTENQLILKTNENNKIEEEQQLNNKKLNPVKFNNKKRSIKNEQPIQDFITNSKNSLIKTKASNNKEDKSIKCNKIMKRKNFCKYYWKYLSLYQSIINLFHPIKCLKIENSYIPTLVKLMRIIFMLSLNMFLNVFHLEQQYYRKKYEYFNNKYNIRSEFYDNKINLNERFKYGFENTIISGLISFTSCLIIDLILNYLIFNIKKKINKNDEREIDKAIIEKKSNSDSIIITYENANDNKNNISINNLIEKENKKHIIFVGITFPIKIFIFYTIITFNEIYRGGISDLIAGTIWTFIFSQISPFLYSIFFAIIRYSNNKNIKQKSNIIFY